VDSGGGGRGFFSYRSGGSLEWESGSLLFFIGFLLLIRYGVFMLICI
jgi:hypothetical protein